MFKLLLTLTLCCMLCSTTAQTTPSGYVYLRGLQSQRCLTIEKLSQANDAIAEVWDCLPDATNEQWELIPLSGNSAGYYMLKVRHSGKCLTVQAMGTANETRVLQWDCIPGGQSNQNWRIVQDSQGYMQLIGQGANKCLTVHYQETQNGAYTVIFDCVGKDNQKWIAQTYGPGSSGSSSGSSGIIYY